MPDRLSYAIVSPVKDEARDLARTAEAIVAQQRLPIRWIIVDDGSSDATPDIARRYAEEFDWIELVQRGAGKDRARGAPVVRAFEHGLAALDGDADVVVKLDGDLYLPPHYFQWVMRIFDEVPTAGLVGGTVFVPEGHQWVPDQVGRQSVHGAIKAYRRTCLDAIGGLKASMGWDGIDEYGARARGWGVHQLTELNVLHYKPRGSKQAWWRARIEEGRGCHFMGYDPRFVLVRAVFRMLKEPPPVLGGLFLGLGYLSSALQRRPQVDDSLAIEELRREQRGRMRRLLRGDTSTDPIPVPGGGPAVRAWGRDGVSTPELAAGDADQPREALARQ